MAKTNLKFKKYCIELLNRMVVGPVQREEFANEMGVCDRTVQNFIHEIRKAGFDITRNKHFYMINKLDKKLELKDHEISILAYFLMLSSFLLPQYKTEVLCRVLEKILLISNKTELINTFKKFDYFKMASFNVEYGDKLRALEKFIVKKANLKVIDKKGNIYYLKPIEFEWEESKVLVKFFDEEKRQNVLISLQDIVKIVPKGVREYTPYAKETIFELYGRLAKSYLLKEDERIVDSTDEKLVIANGSTDKEELFRKLLKYGELCKIILPKDENEEFKKIIDDSILNLKK